MPDALGWLDHRDHWFSRHVECPVRAFDRDGAWRGRLVEPRPRRWAVRVSDWARWETGFCGVPVSGGAIMATGRRLTRENFPFDLEVLLGDVGAWQRHSYRRRSPAPEGPFTEPDAQDVFQVRLTRLFLARRYGVMRDWFPGA